MPSFSTMFAPDTVQQPPTVDDGTSDTDGWAMAEGEELEGPQSSETSEGPASDGDAFVAPGPAGAPQPAEADDGGF